MSSKHKYPTIAQLEKGITIECAGSGDDALEGLTATHVHLTLVEGIDDELDDDIEDADLDAAIVVMARVAGRKRWLFAGIYPMGFETPWEDDDEDPLEDYLDRLAEARGLEDQLLDAGDSGDEDEDDDEDDDDDDDDEDSLIVHVDGKDEFEEEVEKSVVPVLVDFTAAWCWPCQQLAPRLEDLAEEREGKLKVVKVDIDDNEDLALKFGVEAVPTVMMFRGGMKVGEDEGFDGKKALVKFVDQHLA